jgi:hypothetical protein
MARSTNDQSPRHNVEDILYSMAGWPDVELALDEWQQAETAGTRHLQRELAEEVLLRGIRHPDDALCSIADDVIAQISSNVPTLR